MTKVVLIDDQVTVLCMFFIKDYTLEGELGKATDNFCHTGRVIEKTTYGNTYDHIIIAAKSIRIMSQIHKKR